MLQNSHRREALQLRTLRTRLPAAREPHQASPNPHYGEAVRVQRVRKGLQPRFEPSHAHEDPHEQQPDHVLPSLQQDLPAKERLQESSVRPHGDV
ncbi:hypothetical protein L596_019284 [Steinernema carpocapsae]|uniref:Uncharacterized protein n=1 Tax=Steinernema carpocapsae TaxID=34508 RepID=A0A4V6A0Q5_STECR|nr:hypothetical protein L596_019284 [Steinernema carpocapsae]